MKEFKDLKSFGDHFDRLIANYEKHETAGMVFLGKELEKEAKDKIGHHNDGAGPFKDWAPLAPSTLRDKERQGYIFNADGNPLYRTGELRDSIHSVYFAAAKQLKLGSDSEIMEYQELGTRYIPARSVLGLTMYQAHPLIRNVLGRMLFNWLAGKPMMTLSLLESHKGTYGTV